MKNIIQYLVNELEAAGYNCVTSESNTNGESYYIYAEKDSYTRKIRVSDHSVGLSRMLSEVIINNMEDAEYFCHPERFVHTRIEKTVKTWDCPSGNIPKGKFNEFHNIDKNTVTRFSSKGNPYYAATTIEYRIIKEKI